MKVNYPAFRRVIQMPRRMTGLPDKTSPFGAQGYPQALSHRDYF